MSDTWQGSALTDVAIGNFALHADGFVRDAGDYDTPLGTQTNSFFRGHGALAGGSYFFGGGDSRIGAAITQYNAKYGIPADEAYIDMRQTKVMVRSSFALGTGLLKTLDLDGSYSDYAHDEKNPDGSINTTFLNKEYNGRAELLFNQIGFIENTAAGFEISASRLFGSGRRCQLSLPRQFRKCRWLPLCRHPPHARLPPGARWTRRACDGSGDPRHGHLHQAGLHTG